MPYKDKAKQREYMRLWIARRRLDFFKGKSCSCGATENLQLDHIDPSTKVDHKIWSWSQERRDNELAKCQILCASCHSDKTLRDNNLSPRTHGNRKTYDLGCRCSDCRSANTLWQREKRARKLQCP